MSLWEIEYFPAKGERNSPTDKLGEICDIDEQAEFQQKFRTLRELEAKYWSFKWLKPVKGFYQVHQGNFRGYFKLYGRKIVVFHFCRKVANKIKVEDVRIAESNRERYEKGLHE